MIDKPVPPVALKRNIVRTLAWFGFGVGIGLALMAAFFAYSQPELLLEQMNLRYCG